MNWDYIAGLFDGDGNGTISFCRSRYSYSVRIMVKLAVSDEVMIPLLNFLKEENVISYSKEVYNHYGKTKYLEIYKKNSVEIFVKGLLDRCYIKKKGLVILWEALQLKKRIKTKKGRIVNHLKEFDLLRHKLHSLAKKGRKELVEYAF